MDHLVGPFLEAKYQSSPSAAATEKSVMQKISITDVKMNSAIGKETESGIWLPLSKLSSGTILIPKMCNLIEAKISL